MMRGFQKISRRLTVCFRLCPESERFLHLDALRFIASAGIVAFHYQEWVTWRTPPVRLQAMFGFGQFVDLFFVISGIVIYDLYRGRINRPRDYGRFLRKRIARLLPLHLLTLTFFCAIAVLAERVGRTGSRVDWSCLIPNALLVHAFGICRNLSFNTPSWSISAEMAMYVGFPLMAMLSARGRLAWVVWLGILLVLVGLSDESGLPWYERTYDLGVLRAVPAFIFGVLLADRRDLLRRVPAAATLMWIGLTMFVVLRVTEAPPSLRLACVYLIPLFGFAADQQNCVGRTVRAIAPLGQLTYSIYMLHIPVAWAVLSFMAPRLGLTGQAMDLMVLATGLLVLPVTSVASLRLFETPMRRWLSAERLQNKPTAPSKEALGDFIP